VTQNGKRSRDGDIGDSDRHSKREKVDDSDEEMEIDDEEETPQKSDLCMSCCPYHAKYLFHTARSLRKSCCS